MAFSQNVEDMKHAEARLNTFLLYPELLWFQKYQFLTVLRRTGSMMPLASGLAYVGAWVNHSKGSILGATLTVPAHTGRILIAALALLVGWTGSHFWSLVCFVLHQFRATSHSEDGLHYQQQVLLRSRVSDTTILFRLLEIGIAWRKHTRCSIRRILPLLLAASTNIAVFLVAGILSSRATNAGSEVLAKGKCGFLRSVNDPSPGFMTGEILLDRNIFYMAAYTSFREESFYVRSCYGNHKGKESDLCNFYTTPFIESRVDKNASCPFSTDMCSVPAISFDTGLIDSNDHLGINSRSGDRVQMRKVTTCAPIDTEKYSSDWTYEQKLGLSWFFEEQILNDIYRYYNFGDGLLYDVPTFNFTTVISNASVNFQASPYNIDMATFSAENTEYSEFIPIPELSHTDADLTLLFLTNRAIYTGEVNDPWFKATTQIDTTWSNDTRIPDSILSVIGCTEQY
ncbi:hypothetical protein BGZ60DRAFT_437287 [Tricladium varicosporioides]|nr:hypothetical protein BGZ60DRAFT_437287 [Hymenoscyphus varicosporioides]